MIAVDPIVAFSLDPIRLPDANYRQQQRRRLLLEIDLSDDKQIQLDGTMISRNEVIEAFSLLDAPDVREYLDIVHASWRLRELWIDGHADEDSGDDLRTTWSSLIHLDSHKHFRSRWQAQWTRALKTAFDERVSAESFSTLIECCDADRELNATCYEKIKEDVQSLETEIDLMINAVEVGEFERSDVGSLISDTSAFELISHLPPSCNGIQTSLAQSLRNLSVALHNAEVADDMPVDVLHLACRAVANCEVYGYYEQELESLLEVRRANEDWERVNSFATRLRAAIEKIRNGARRGSVSTEVQELEEEAPTIAKLANELTREDGDRALCDGIANMLLTLAVLVHQRYSAPRCATNLAAAVRALRCQPEVTETIDSVAARFQQPQGPTRGLVNHRGYSKAKARLKTSKDPTPDSASRPASSAEEDRSVAVLFLAVVLGCVVLALIVMTGSEKEVPPTSNASDKSNQQVWPSHAKKQIASFPPVTALYSSGVSELVIDNSRQSAGVTAMVKAGSRGRQFHVNGFSTNTVDLPNGWFEIYFIYDNDPYSLYQGDSFALKQNEQVTLVLQKQVGGNYNVRKIE